MKKIFYTLILSLIFSGLIFSCGYIPEGIDNDVNIEKSYEVRVIDKCEYIYVSRRPFGSEFSLTHKGNCKFCAERRKQYEKNTN